ncbi:Inositol-tetrakisphosphate 1-kinase isoform 1 [Schistosoma japonicum]|uniref:Inositol-tetrakisphosphate 1-kinase n=1 Tax=Schistosoma japonicum TaxID=6182 RepID=A0A4Z2DTJ1_SCHJA|nr:Inositol-tetrakisphosphate 1-kinase [Schistosoma japonicum]TNN19805.1 Inositol-tetrakisphosphate 1-kinase isoform 1 [Schistosoma japonicum]
MKVVGVWMSEAKADSIGLSTLLHERSDLLFRKINPFTNISEQGPFDVILHKIPEFLNCDSTTSSQNVIKDFINYSETNPNVIYIDPPISLRCLLTRFDQFSMLRDLVGVWSIRKEIFVPKFCLLSKNDPTELCEAGISYPVVCKSLMAHGQDSVHEIAIVFDDSGLNNLRYPIFVQQFINHNGKVLKLFVIGDYSCVTEVPSIKNQENSTDKTPIFFHSHSVSKDGCQSPLSESSSFSNKQTICSYDKPLFNMLANEIRKSLKIDLFGIDLICETDNSTPDTLSKPNRYAIIDLNIFPSYKNVHGFLFYLENLIRGKLCLPLLSKDTNDVQK